MEDIKLSLSQAGPSGELSIIRVDGVVDTITASELEDVIETLIGQKRHKILVDLGSAQQETAVKTVEVGSTRVNLKRATDVELHEIDTKYPSILDRLAPEHHEDAMLFITYAWQAEQQHRELIKKIRSGTGFFFFLLARKLKDVKDDFVVCHYCGSTLMEIPPDICPICGKSAVWYKKIEATE